VISTPTLKLQKCKHLKFKKDINKKKKYFKVNCINFFQAIYLFNFHLFLFTSLSKLYRIYLLQYLWKLKIKINYFSIFIIVLKHIEFSFKFIFNFFFTNFKNILIFISIINCHIFATLFKNFIFSCLFIWIIIKKFNIFCVLK
jgi:hypothetical protein